MTDPSRAATNGLAGAWLEHEREVRADDPDDRDPEDDQPGRLDDVAEDSDHHPEDQRRNEDPEMRRDDGDNERQHDPNRILAVWRTTPPV